MSANGNPTRPLTIIGIAALEGTGFAAGLAMMLGGDQILVPVGAALVGVSVSSALAIQMGLLKFRYPQGGVRCPACHNRVYSTGQAMLHALRQDGTRACQDAST